MRIAVCSLTYPLPNGVTSSVNESVDGFVAAGHEIVIIAPEYGQGPVRKEHRPVSSSSFGKALVRFFGKKERMFSLRAGHEIKEIFDDFQPEAFWLHTVTWAPNAFEKAMLESDGRKVLTYHTMLDMYGRMYVGVIGEQAMILRSKEIANNVDEVITPSQFMAGKLKDWGVTQPISVIPTGIHKPKHWQTAEQLRAKFKLPTDAQIMLYVGRVVKEKNIEALLALTKRVVAKKPNAYLVLIGPGDIEQTMEEANNLGIGRNVICSGQMPLEEAKACYHGADVFVFASQSETQGLVVGEAMIAHTPVAALRSPIQAEVYPESVARVADTIPELARHTIELLDNPEIAKKLANTAFEFVSKEFTKEKMLEKQMAVFARQPAIVRS